MKKILVVSSANMDMVLNVNSVPVAGQTVIDNGSYSYVPGGKGANSALAFARLGGKCTFVTRVGMDQTGDELVDLYRKEGIDTCYLKRATDAKTGLATIFVEGSGQNRIIVFPGANQKITPDQIDQAIAEAKPDALFLQFEINHDAILYATRVAREAKIPIFIDAGAITPDFPLDKLPELELFSPNESEALTICGISPDSEEKCLEASRAISKLIKAKHIVLKLGSRGAYIYNGSSGELIPTLPIKPVDTTAAGDAFTAALTLKYLECGSIREACAYAHVAGTITVTRKGASSSIPTRDEVEAFIVEMKKKK
ncbi:MAG: ribokinase [Clostridia bacterium]|nr:ribokinase [Clostridia bacterium]